MPRPGPRRVYFGGRLFTPDEHVKVQQLADRDTGGNLSGMVRRLVLEALDHRERSTGQIGAGS